MIPEANVGAVRSLTVIVPCYNEAANVRQAMASLWECLRGTVHDFEILIVNDGSTDETGSIIDGLAAKYPGTRALHLPVNRGMGYAFFYALARGTKKHVTVFVGDNEIEQRSFRALLEQIGTADILMAYHSNPSVRPWHRRGLSLLFTMLVRWITNTRLRYYNGPAIHPREAVLSLGIENDGFGFLAEITTSLLRLGHSYRELPIELRPRRFGISQALRWKSVREVASTLGRMAVQQKLAVGAACS